MDDSSDEVLAARAPGLTAASPWKDRAAVMSAMKKRREEIAPQGAGAGAGAGADESSSGGMSMSPAPRGAADARGAAGGGGAWWGQDTTPRAPSPPPTPVLLGAAANEARGSPGGGAARRVSFAVGEDSADARAPGPEAGPATEQQQTPRPPAPPPGGARTPTPGRSRNAGRKGWRSGQRAGAAPAGEERAAGEDAFRRALERDPGNIDTLLNFARFLQDSARDPARAAPLLERALALAPSHPPVLARYARFLEVRRPRRLAFPSSRPRPRLRRLQRPAAARC